MDNNNLKDHISLYSYFFLRVFFLFRKGDEIESSLYGIPKDPEDYKAIDVVLVFSILLVAPIIICLKNLNQPFSISAIVFMVCFAAHYYYWVQLKTNVAIKHRFREFKPDTFKDFLLLFYIALMVCACYLLL